MINLIVLMVKLMISGIKLNILFSGWDGFIEQINGFLRRLNEAKGEETE